MVGEVIAGRYELEALVDTGGMASVYRAHDRLLERTVALKLLHDRYSSDEHYVERFRREARAAAGLSHPNIVTVIDRGEQDGRQFIVFEHVDGDNLKQIVRTSGALPVRQALELTLQIARALSFAHGHGLVHRDVKPQNILLNGDGRAKVTDFGIARSVDVDGGTLTGTVLGTSHYLAPEQARGERADAQSDVYSLGAVLFELLTGEVLFSGDNFVTVAMRHVNEPAPSLLERRPDAPVRVARLVQRALEKRPDDRFGSMDELVAELEACLAELEDEQGVSEPTLIVPRTELAPPSAGRPVQGRRLPLWPLVALLAGLAIGAILAGVYLVRGSIPSPIGKSHTAVGPPVHLSGVTSFDPYGDNGQEHSDLAPRATDGDVSTYWETEGYIDFSKPGVGLVLDARRSVKVSSITVSTDSPDHGFTAEIRAGTQETGPFDPVSDSKAVNSKTTFELHQSKPARYYLLWITDLAGSRAHVTEVTAG